MASRSRRGSAEGDRPSGPVVLPCPHCKGPAERGPNGHVLDHMDAMGTICPATGSIPDGE